MEKIRPKVSRYAEQLSHPQRESPLKFCHSPFEKRGIRVSPDDHSAQ
jgi:hypothetical protein